MVQKYFSRINLFFISTVHAEEPGGPKSFTIQQPPGLGIPGKELLSAENAVGTIIANAVALFFAVGAIGVLIFFLWGAVDWIFSGGDKEKVAGARKKITNALIGLALLSLAFVIIGVFGRIVGFDVLGPLQIRGLGDTGNAGNLR